MWDKLTKQLLSMVDKKNSQPFIAVDIGTSSIKILSLELKDGRTKILGVGIAPTPANAFSNSGIVKSEQVGAAIKTLLETNEIVGTKVIFSLPTSLVFSKKVSIAQTPLKELEESIAYEAGNYIPHAVEAVHIDYQVLGSNGKSMELLIVAVKNEVIESYKKTLELAGLVPAIADIDSFAIENMFELNYPEEKEKTIALIHIGARSTVVSICSGGQSLIVGDIGVGGRLYTDALCEACNMQPTQAEMAKSGRQVDGFDDSLIAETIERTTEHLSSEIHRQLGFLWNAAGTEKTIEGIFLGGGSSAIPGLVEDLANRTGIFCQRLEAFRNIDRPENFDEAFLEEVSGAMGVGVGLAIRRFADKQHMVQ